MFLKIFTYEIYFFIIVLNVDTVGEGDGWWGLCLPGPPGTTLQV